MEDSQSLGTGIIWKTKVCKRASPWESKTVFQAVVYATLMTDADTARGTRQYTIYSDSQVALKTICSTKAKRQYLVHCTEASEVLTEAK